MCDVLLGEGNFSLSIHLRMEISLNYYGSGFNLNLSCGMSWSRINHRYCICNRIFYRPLRCFLILWLVRRLFFLVIYNFCYDDVLIIDIMLIWIFVLFINFFRLIKPHNIQIIFMITKQRLVIWINITPLRLFEFRIIATDRFSWSNWIFIFFIPCGSMNFAISTLILRYQRSNITTKISTIWIFNRFLSYRSTTLRASVVEICMISTATNSIRITKWPIHFLCFLWFSI